MRTVKISRHYAWTSAEKKVNNANRGCSTFLGGIRRFNAQNREMHLKYNGTMSPHFNINVRVFY